MYLQYFIIFKSNMQDVQQQQQIKVKSCIPHTACREGIELHYVLELANIFIVDQDLVWIGTKLLLQHYHNFLLDPHHVDHAARSYDAGNLSPAGPPFFKAQNGVLKYHNKSCHYSGTVKNLFIQRSKKQNEIFLRSLDPQIP